jgi:hypothetical protein
VSPDLREGILKCVRTDLVGLMKMILGKCRDQAAKNMLLILRGGGGQFLHAAPSVWSRHSRLIKWAVSVLVQYK